MKNLQIKFLNNCLLIKDILVIGDLHLGYEGFGIIDEIIEKLEGVFLNLKEDGIKVKKIILLGDVKYDFQGISDNEWRDILRLLDYLIKKVSKKNIIIIKGNHDNILKPILKKREIKLKDYYKIKKKIDDKVLNIWFLHGNKMFGQLFKQPNRQTENKTNGGVIKQTNKQAHKKDILILGHLHPAIILNDKYKKEKYKCFLCGNWKGFIVYILPSFSPMGYGYDLRNLINKDYKREYLLRNKGVRTHEFFIIPNKDLMIFKVVVYDEKNGKEYEFGKLKKLIK